jgi:aryl-alcohol dehydrogenase-like predicted oxidoreductase
MVDFVDLGSQGLRVPRLGLGVMSTAFYGSGDPASDEMQQLAAIDKLVEICAPSPCFLDTAFLYAHPTGLHSEAIVGKAIAKHGRKIFVIATKFGVTMQGPDSSTEAMHAQYAASVARLGSAPDLYYQHRPDPKRSIKDVMADLKAMHSESKFKYIGLSECTPNELRDAHAIFPVSCVQME